MYIYIYMYRPPEAGIRCTPHTRLPEKRPHHQQSPPLAKLYEPRKTCQKREGVRIVLVERFDDLGGCCGPDERRGKRCGPFSQHPVVEAEIRSTTRPKERVHNHQKTPTVRRMNRAKPFQIQRNRKERGPVLVERFHDLGECCGPDEHRLTQSRISPSTL